MTNPLYMGDTYLLAISTRVTEVGSDARGRWLETEETICHPQGGGQPADVGTIDGLTVVPSFADIEGTRRIRHYYESDVSFEPHMAVRMALDTPRRLGHAALHTAGHLLDAIMTAWGFEHRMGNHFPGEARVEFKARPDKTPAKEEVASEMNRQIAAELPITCTSSDGERHIAIGSYPPGRCGGTHVRTTADLVNFAIRSIKVKKGVLRIGYDVAHRPL